MKKILIAMMMLAGATNAHAFEFKVNGDTLITQIIQQVVTQTVGDQMGDGKHVIVHTGNAAQQKKITTVLDKYYLQ